MVQRHAAGGAFAVEIGPLGLASGGGRPLPDAVRGKMEAALGANFADVRVHVGPQAERIGAIAFTVGSDIYFAPGRFQPDTMHGQQLLGHELAHVVQQRAGRVRNPLGSGLVVVQDHALEAEADRLGQRVAAHPVTAEATMAAGASRPFPAVRLRSPNVVASTVVPVWHAGRTRDKASEQAAAIVGRPIQAMGWDTIAIGVGVVAGMAGLAYWYFGGRSGTTDATESSARPVRQVMASRATDTRPLVQWLKDNDPGTQPSNFSVGLTDSYDIIISKVGGLGSDAKIVGDLKPFLRKSYSTSNVYLAGSYSKASLSGNHAEMCVVAGANQGGKKLRSVICTHPNCDFCRTMMDHLSITCGSITEGTPGTQPTWVHPTKRAMFGTQYGERNMVTCVKALDDFNRNGTRPPKNCANVEVSWSPCGSLKQLFF
jgi:hypothetical protein